MHTLKGTAGTLGVENVEKCSREMEHNLRNSNFSTINSDFENLNNAFEDFQAHYKKHIKTE